MSWRREVEALVRPPRDMPAVFVTLERGIPTARVVHAGGAFFDSVASREAAPDDAPAAAAPARSRSAAEAVTLPFADGSARYLVLSFLGDASDARRRAAIITEVARVATPGASIVVVDHNRPRHPAAAIVALVRSPRPAGWQPIAAWQRLAYPSARELRAAGFAVDRLRLAADERLQVISARRRARD